MQKIILLSLIVFFPQLLLAQINAVTQTGDEVMLYKDGTWKYLNDFAETETMIPINNIEYKKTNNLTFLVKSNRFNIGLWINPKEWTFVKGTNNDAYEYEFEKKGEDLFGMMITEKVEIPLKSLRKIALKNARSAAADARITKEEFRKINGNQVLMLQMEGTLEGVKFVYFGYYFSNSNGSVQLIVYTGENLFKEYKNDIEQFLNGFVAL